MTKLSFMKTFIPFLLVGLTGCESIRTRSEIARSQEQATDELVAQVEVKPENDIEAEDLPIPEIKQPTVKQQSEKKRIPVVRNAAVEKWIKYFSIKDRERFQRFLNRGQKYRDVVENVLEENDLPAELYYLAMIESGYQLEAHSHAKAKGVWQFIPGTATRYGLRVDRYVDERKDPIRSTEAAAKYLRDLYNVFGSWPLAMSAYNAGEIRILRAVFRGKSRDFWKLSDSKVLPKETAEYVPKFLAVVLIGMNPTKYGFTDPSERDSFPSVESLEVPGSLKLAHIAKSANIPLSALKAVNPHLQVRTPPGKEYELWVPSEHVASVRSVGSQLAKLARPERRSLASAKRSSKAPIHIVRRGENLSVIARRYKVSVGHLKRMNKLKSNRVYVGARLRVKPQSYRPSKTVRYIVKRGDNLTFIAKKFKTTVGRLRSLNKLRKNKIVVGQVLRLDSLPL